MGTVYDVPVGFKSEFILKSIGNFVGRFLEADPKNFQGMCRNYLRIRVVIDVHRPLKSQMRIKKAGGEWMWIQFKYDRLPSFCFYCGRIGHTEKFCEDLFDNLHGNATRKYSSSLRAPLRSQSISKENQWIRGADGTVLYPAKGNGKERESGVTESHSKEDNVNYAKEHHDPRKSGNSEPTSEIRGKDQANKFVTVEAQVSANLNERRESDKVDMDPDEIYITDPKRRRINNPTTGRPNNNLNNDDDDMVENQTEETQDPKNLLPAGATRQTRHAL